MSRTPFSNVNNIHVHFMIPEDQKNMTAKWCSTGRLFTAATQTFFSYVLIVTLTTYCDVNGLNKTCSTAENKLWMELLDKLFFFTFFVNFKAYELPLNIKRVRSNFPQSVFSSNGTILRGETKENYDFWKITILRATLGQAYPKWRQLELSAQ